MADTDTLAPPYVEEFVTDDEHPAGLYAFACNICQRDVGGLCGRCAPWPCCGAQTIAHMPGCREDV